MNQAPTVPDAIFAFRAWSNVTIFNADKDTGRSSFLDASLLIRLLNGWKKKKTTAHDLQDSGASLYNSELMITVRLH